LPIVFIIVIVIVTIIIIIITTILSSDLGSRFVAVVHFAGQIRAMPILKNEECVFFSSGKKCFCYSFVDCCAQRFAPSQSLVTRVGSNNGSLLLDKKE
jgi:hypothetical protein